MATPVLDGGIFECKKGAVFRWTKSGVYQRDISPEDPVMVSELKICMDESFTIRAITFHAEYSCTFTLGLKWQILGLSLLTASVRGELPEVQVFHWEVDKSGQFAGSDAGFREALQI